MTAILVEFDKAGKNVGAGQVTEIIKRLGAPAEAVKKIVILPADKTHKQITIILLTDLAAEDQARHIAIGDATQKSIDKRNKYRRSILIKPP